MIAVNSPPADVDNISALLVVKVSEGRLIVEANIPLRWAVVIFSILGAVLGYPSLVEVAKTLLSSK